MESPYDTPALGMPVEMLDLFAGSLKAAMQGVVDGFEIQIQADF